jgi:hypothetical protein
MHGSGGNLSMLISPEHYYEENLKEKTVQEIRSRIRVLKTRITRLKRKIENVDDIAQIVMNSSQETQMAYTRLYLERVKQALVEAGETYKPSKAEQKADAFNASLLSIDEIRFSIGGFFGGYEKKTLTFDEKHLYMESSFSTSLYATDNVEKTKDFPFSKDEFLSQLKELHIGEWDSRYDSLALDGTQWHLGIYFSNVHEDVEIYGSNAYPYNFNKLCELLVISRFFWPR